MTPVLKLNDARRVRADRQTLCRSGFHKWQLVADRRFADRAKTVSGLTFQHQPQRGSGGVGSLLRIIAMTTVVKLQTARRARADRQTLCRSGFHKWQLVADRRFADGTEARATVQGRAGCGFDVKAGKLLTAERCRRCGEQRTRLL